MLKESDYVRIIVAVPVEHADAVRAAINDAGGSRQGMYEYASGSHPSIGRFRPLPGAHPSIGKIGEVEEVEEEVIETLCHRDNVAEVVAAIKKIHPYEEPPIDIIPRLEVEI